MGLWEACNVVRRKLNAQRPYSSGGKTTVDRRRPGDPLIHANPTPLPGTTLLRPHPLPCVVLGISCGLTISIEAPPSERSRQGAGQSPTAISIPVPCPVLVLNHRI